MTWMVATKRFWIPNLNSGPSSIVKEPVTFVCFRSSGTKASLQSKDGRQCTFVTHLDGVGALTTALLHVFPQHAHVSRQIPAALSHDANIFRHKGKSHNAQNWQSTSLSNEVVNVAGAKAD